MDGGDNSVYIGFRAGYGGGSGSYNIAVGSDALYDIDAGAGNVCMGHHALEDVTSGDYNVGIGTMKQLVTPPQVIIMSLTQKWRVVMLMEN